MGMIDKVREALQITSTASDSELQDLIDASVIDLNIAGVEGDTVTTSSTDPIAQRAIITYVAYQFEQLHGSIDRAEKLKASYDEQKTQLSMHTGYTDWGTVNGE